MEIPHRFFSTSAPHHGVATTLWRQGINQRCEVSPWDQVLDHIKSRYEKNHPKAHLSYQFVEFYHWNNLRFLPNISINRNCISNSFREVGLTNHRKPGRYKDTLKFWRLAFPNYICCVTCPHCIANLRNRPFWASFMVSFL